MKILITGVSGFAGSHLAEHLLAQGKHEIFGSIKWRSDRKNILHIQDKLKLCECDIRDAFAMNALISDIKPHWIFHLAAQSYVPFSWRAPQETLTTNIIGEVNLFEAVRQAGIDPLIHIAGSSEEYGMVYSEEIPIKETNPLRPLSPYGVSKVAQDFLGFQYFKSYGLKIVRTRAFNHTGPRRGVVFATSNFAKQIIEIKEGKRKPVLHVGNLEAVRDFLDVRDVARAYALALEKGTPGEVYVIASGKGTKIKEMLEKLIAIAQIEVEIKEDPERLRPSDVELLVGSSEKFQKATGWKPEIPFDKTLKDLLDFWQQQIE
ncbi:NAD-dependent epimerase [candidate division WOR_3 bacterium SM23_60]|uniref:NAD-dependent epimerase n=1 Tax=candidate division WOR_3 bacterium SM23_60 TaxID=1703780 RepID=A0A0S8GGS8_UNCW3|nr:MAG: NAD-dependent epimerase [candidate division WOR_3 bacterium SM23_60]